MFKNLSVFLVGIIIFSFQADLLAEVDTTNSSRNGFSSNVFFTDIFNDGSPCCASVTAIAIQPDKKILISGEFQSVFGVRQRRMARLNTDGSLDQTFNASLDGRADTVLLQDDGKVLVAGDFSNVNGVDRAALARLNPDGSFDATFPDLGIEIFDRPAIALHQGKILVENRILGQRLIRYNLDGTVDSTFESADIRGTISSVFVDSQDRILVSGELADVSIMNPPQSADPHDPPRSTGMIRLLPDGASDRGFIVNTETVYEFGAVTKNNQVMAFSRSTNEGLVRLNEDGSRDSSFSSNVTISSVRSVVIFDSDDMVLAGSYLSSRGSSRRGLFKVLSDGTLDTQFYTDSDDSVVQIALQDDGSFLIGGLFSFINNVPRLALARIELDGSLDTSSDPTRAVLEIVSGNNQVTVVPEELERKTFDERLVVRARDNRGRLLSGVSVNFANLRGETSGRLSDSANAITDSEGLASIEVEPQPILGSFQVIAGALGTNVVQFSLTIDEDSDGDSIPDEVDNCPESFNSSQRDLDGDSIGNVCDPDIDGDSINNEDDNCPVAFNPDQADSDLQTSQGELCELKELCFTIKATNQKFVSICL